MYHEILRLFIFVRKWFRLNAGLDSAGKGIKIEIEIAIGTIELPMDLRQQLYGLDWILSRYLVVPDHAMSIVPPTKQLNSVASEYFAALDTVGIASTLKGENDKSFDL
ncbi:hypothetical protein BTUL_0028g00610 [Botrytis tulipae]|uniref:Uncharacterized protein n=1 Tax=Botrytis tulipae TaxID=87230 RepID=A0A4Z1EYR4_9HELO|nr:hypothetical protein BTUL_0028g00610 [Botrytis tulipae]